MSGTNPPKKPAQNQKKKTNPLSKERSWCIEKTAWSFKVAIILPPSKIQVRKRKGNFPKLNKTCPLLSPLKFCPKIKEKKTCPLLPTLDFLPIFLQLPFLFPSCILDGDKILAHFICSLLLNFRGPMQFFRYINLSLVRGVDGVQFFEQMVGKSKLSTLAVLA